MEHVYWIGGGSGAGKSTIALRLLEEHRVESVYETDEVMGQHFQRSAPADVPYLRRFAAMDMDERWLNRTPQEMLETFHWFRGEAFPLILADLAHSAGLPTIAEGFRLLPELVAPMLTDPRRAVWLLPTPEFRRAALEKRGDLWTIAGKTSNPRRALDNLLQRDALFTDRLAVTAARLDLQVIRVDGSQTEDALTARVADSLGLAAAH